MGWGGSGDGQGREGGEKGVLGEDGMLWVSM